MWQDLMQFKNQLAKTAPNQQKQIPEHRSGRVLRKFNSISSLHSINDTDRRLKQLEIPFIVGSSKNSSLLNCLSAGQLDGVWWNKNLYPKPQPSQVLSQPSNRKIKRLRFVKKNKNKIKEHWGDQEQIMSEIINIKSGGRMFPFGKKMTSNKNLLQQQRQNVPRICQNCRLHIEMNEKLKNGVKNISSVINKMKQEYRQIVQQLAQMKEQLQSKINAFIKIEKTNKIDQILFIQISAPDKVKKFIQELSVEIDRVFQKQLNRTHFRDRADIGKIIKNTLPRFEREDSLPLENSETYNSMQSIVKEPQSQPPPSVSSVEAGDEKMDNSYYL